MTILELTDENFEAEVLQSPAVLVDFWATWCGPCRALGRVIAEVADAHAGRLKLAKLNVDDWPRLATRFDVRSVPTLLLFKDGNVVAQIVGAVGKAKIEALLQRV